MERHTSSEASRKRVRKVVRVVDSKLELKFENIYGQRIIEKRENCPMKHSTVMALHGIVDNTLCMYVSKEYPLNCFFNCFAETNNIFSSTYDKYTIVLLDDDDVAAAKGKSVSKVLAEFKWK